MYSFLKLFQEGTTWRKDRLFFFLPLQKSCVEHSRSSALFSVQGVGASRYRSDRFYAEYHRAQQRTSQPLHREMPSMFSPIWVHGKFYCVFITKQLLMSMCYSKVSEQTKMQSSVASYTDFVCLFGATGSASSWVGA